MGKDDRSFRLDTQARSFRPSDFGLGDVPWIVIALPVAMAVIGGLGFLFDRLAALLPPRVRYLMIGSALGYLVGLRVGDWSRRRLQISTPHDPKPDEV